MTLELLKILRYLGIVDTVQSVRWTGNNNFNSQLHYYLLIPSPALANPIPFLDERSYSHVYCTTVLLEHRVELN